nr:hypothetical protein [Tanacetum cinerariifolium]
MWIITRGDETLILCLKDPDGEDVDVHTHSDPKSFTSPCSKEDFRYLKGKPRLGLWYPKDLPFDLIAYSDSDYDEATIRDALRLDDAERVDCLSNEEIFAELARMGYEKPSTKLTFYKAFFSSKWKFLIHTILQSMSAKRTSWNKFSSAMASAVICLSTGRKFNFSKYIFESLVRNVDSNSKFYMYLRFIQLIIKNQLGDLLTYTTKYTSPALTQKVFANMRRVGKGFSRAKTLLFKGMLVGVIEEQGDAEEQVQDDVNDAAAQRADTGVQGDDVHEPSIPSPTQPTPPPQQSQDLPSTSQRIDTSEDNVMEDASNQRRMIDDLDKDDVVDLMDDKGEEKKEDKVKDDQVKRRQTKIYHIDMDHASKVLSMDAKEESTTIIPADTKSKDKGKGIMVEELKPLKKKQQVEMDEEYARKFHEELNKDIDWDVAIDHVKQKAKEDPFVQNIRLDYFKGMSYDDIRLIFKAKFKSNIVFLLKTKEHLEEEENRAIESINETSAQKATKRRKLNEEVKDLKRYLEILPNEDDDVYIQATPLARKVPVVDYEIIHLINKPHYKIIRADGTHQLYCCQEKVDAIGLVLLKDELMLLSQVNTANVILMMSRQSAAVGTLNFTVMSSAEAECVALSASCAQVM